MTEESKGQHTHTGPLSLDTATHAHGESEFKQSITHTHGPLSLGSQMRTERSAPAVASRPDTGDHAKALMAFWPVMVWVFTPEARSHCRIVWSQEAVNAVLASVQATPVTAFVCAVSVP